MATVAGRLITLMQYQLIYINFLYIGTWNGWCGNGWLQQYSGNVLGVSWGSQEKMFFFAYSECVCV